MKTVEKQVLQKKTFYIAKDGEEFDNIIDCKRHEWDLAVSDAHSRFEFTYRDGSYESVFTAVYHADMKDAFAEDLSVIIKSMWDVESSNNDDEYNPDTIMDTFEKELGCKLIDGHTYSFHGMFSYTDEDHADDFSMEIEDVTDGDAAEKQYRECKETLIENCPARDFMEIAKRQVKDFGKNVVRRVLNEMVDNICEK
jgi:hypothetical protein